MTPLATQLTQPVLDKLTNTVANLYERWQNERDYEDFASYRKAMTTVLDGLRLDIVAMTQRPFEVRFNLPESIGYIRVTSPGYVFDFEREAYVVTWGQYRKTADAD